MTAEFRNIMDFLNENMVMKPPFWECFQDIYVQVPADKKPPDRNVYPQKFSKNYKFAEMNRQFVCLTKDLPWKELERHARSLLWFCFNDCTLAKRTKNGAYMVLDLKVLKDGSSEFFKRVPKISVPEDHYNSRYVEGAKWISLKNLRPHNLEVLLDRTEFNP